MRVVALGGLATVRRSPRAAQVLVIVALVIGLGATALLARAATLGGHIRHPEIIGSMEWLTIGAEDHEHGGTESGEHEHDEGEEHSD